MIFWAVIADISLDRVEVLAVPGRPRSVIRRDPVEQAMIQGREIQGWKEVANDGFSARGTGYLRFTVQSPTDQVMLLNASGAGMIYVNGEPRVGDVYGYGNYFVPVFLKQGLNSLVASANRGGVTLKWQAPNGELEVSPHDSTLPDVVEGRLTSPYASFVVHNNSRDFRRVTLRGPDGNAMETVTLLPLSTSKIPVRLPMDQESGTVALFEGYTRVASHQYRLETKASGTSYRVTFFSKADSSVQYYAVNKATTAGDWPIVLSLHGASVEALGQAQAYSHKPDFHLVAPTNRRPYGLDWEDLGRVDGLEALRHAQSQLPTEGTVFLTGHSMGGHGTWQLGAHHPGIFAAIAPCAGWISFDTYAGGANYDVNHPQEMTLHQMNSPIRTLELKENFAVYSGIYVHHGDADATVPASEARTMVRELSPFGNVQSHFEPGAGHWFDNDPAPGADSVDWKPIFDMFRAYRPKPDPTEFTFATLDPGISSDFRGYAIVRQLQTRVKSTLTKKDKDINTTNIRVIGLPRGHGINTIDGQKIDKERRFFELKKGKWQPTRTQEPPQEAGFKAVFNKNPGIGLSTSGPKVDQETAILVARYLQEVSWYRANATPRIILNPKPGSPAIRIGTAKSLQIKFPTKDSLLLKRDDKGGRPGALILASDPVNLKLAARFPFFTAGAAMPDLLLVDPKMLDQGSAGIKRVEIWDH